MRFYLAAVGPISVIDISKYWAENSSGR